MALFKSIIAAAFFAALTTAGAAETKAPLTSPPAPFAQKDAGRRQEIFKPDIKGSSIVSGNKKLDMLPDGHAHLFADGRLVSKIYFYLTVFDKKTNKKSWFTVGDKKWMPDAALKTEGGKFIYSGGVSAEGEAAGSVTQTVEIAPDGLISFAVEFSPVENSLFNVSANAVFFDFQTELAQGRKVVFGGKDFTISGEGQIFSGSAPDIEFFPDSPDISLAIKPAACKNEQLGFSKNAGKNGGYNLRLTPDRKDQKVSFLLDIRRGAQPKSSADLTGGIDFKAIEDLEMPDYKSSKNLMPNPSFEQGLKNLRIMHYFTGKYYPGADKWTDIFSIDRENAFIGKSCLKIKTPYASDKRVWRDSFSGPLSPILAASPIPLDPGSYTVSFYAKCDRPGEQTLSFNNVQIKPTAEWKRYEFNVSAEGGRFIPSIKGMTSRPGGNIWVDAVQLEKGPKATEFAPRAAEGVLLTSAPGNFLKTGDRIDAALKIISKPGAAGELKVTVKDFFSDKLFEDSFRFNCGKDGEALIKLPLDGKIRRGVFVVKAEYTLDSGEKTYDFFRFSVMDFLENKHRLKDIFSYDYGDISGMPDFPAILERWKYIGCGSATFLNVWLKDCFDLYAKHGVLAADTAMLGHKSVEPGTNTKLKNPEIFIKASGPYDNKWVALDDWRAGNPAAPLTEEYLKKFRGAAAEAAKNAPWVKNWKLDSELGGGAKFHSSRGDMVRLIEAFAKGVKDGNPSAGVILDDGCNMSSASGIEELDKDLESFKGKVKFDIIATHPYRSSPESPDLDSDVQTLLKMLDKHGYSQTPVFFTEGMNYGPYEIPQWKIKSANWTWACWNWGALSYDMGWTEKIASAWRARSWLVAFKYQDRVKVMSAGGSNIFELDADLTPYACQKIPNTLGRLLGDAYFKKDIRFAPYTRCYVFEDAQKRPVAAVWGCYPKLDAGVVPPFEASANFGGKTPEIFDLMETERLSKPDDNGNIKFPVSSFPLFFRGAPGDLPDFIKTFEGASLLSAEGISPLSLGSRVTGPGSMDITVKNLRSMLFTGQLDAAGKERPINVAPSAEASFPAPLPQPLSASAIKAEKIEAQVTDSSTGKSFKTDCSFEGFVCEKAKSPIKIDGDIDDWKDIPEVKLENRLTRDKSLKSLSDSDFSGWFKTAWDEKGFYLCVKITDDKFILKEHQKAAENWNNDTLQVYFDTLCDARRRETRGYDISEYDYTVYPADGGKKSEVFMRRSPDIQLTLGLEAFPDNAVAGNVPSAFKQTDGGYIYEVFFPAVRLMPAKMEKGYNIGFGLFVNDRDDIESKEPKSALTITPPGTGCYNNPHLWPVMLLWE